MKTYRNLVLLADKLAIDNAQIQGFSVQLLDPGGGQSQAESVQVPPGLASTLRSLLKRNLDNDEMIELGETLAGLLLPPAARAFFLEGLGKLEPSQGLRLQLRLAPGLAPFPWELLYLPTDGKRDSTGFLALNPQVSMARFEAVGSLTPDSTPKPRRMLMAMASPQDNRFDELDLKGEKMAIEAALKDLPGLSVDYIEHTDLKALEDHLTPGADIFHFAGHGQFEQEGPGATIGSVAGRGSLILLGEGGAAPVRADELAVNLQSRGVQLVVLGACETGRRDPENPWRGVATALLGAKIPAVVAMQNKVWDEAAKAFSASFYRALVAGFPLDYAVSAGRIAMFNRANGSSEESVRRKYWQDWALPVLYLRSDQDFVLAAVQEEGVRKNLEDSLELVVRQRLKTLKGRVWGLRGSALPDRDIKIEQEIETVEETAEAVGVELDSIRPRDRPKPSEPGK